MIRPRPYVSPEFLSSMGIVPFDYEADMAAEQFRQQQASLVYRVRLREAARRRRQRQFLAAIAFVAACFAIGFAATYCGACFQ